MYTNVGLKGYLAGDSCYWTYKMHFPGHPQILLMIISERLLALELR